MKQISVLWIDDEIDLLRVHLIYLESKGYKVDQAYNGNDAIDMVRNNCYDILFLDENMPGLTGLETLDKIKEIDPGVPVVMVTKNEGEQIIDEAVGSGVNDYLIKPVNPKQIVISIKTNIEKRSLMLKKLYEDYRTGIQTLSQAVNSDPDINDYKNLYRQIVDWEIKLDRYKEPELYEMLSYQKNEIDAAFCRYIEKNYQTWINNPFPDRPLMQHDVFKEKIIPLLKNNEKIFWIVVDNLRYDQCPALLSSLNDYFNVENKEMICSILPTSTQYARNAMFSGLTPLQIKNFYPQFWIDEDEDTSKNDNEQQLIQTALTRFKQDIKFSYSKSFTNEEGKRYNARFSEIKNNKLNIAVYNFVDTMSHSHTDSQLLKELFDDEAAYRSITKTWFEHSSLFDLLKLISKTDYKVILTTDHGNVKVNKAIKVTGAKEITDNPRYKQGRNMEYKTKEVFEMSEPEKFQLPTLWFNAKFIFAHNKDFMVYPNNFNKFVSRLEASFQHGGISMEEMLIPFVTLTAKKH